MKRIFILLQLVFLVSYISTAQYVSLPNDGFKAVLMAKYPACFNGAGDLDTTCSAIVTEDSLVFSGLSGSNDFSALAYFDNLKFLDCSNNTFNTYMSTVVFPATLPTTLRTLIANSCYEPYWAGNYATSILSRLPSGLERLTFDNNACDYFGSVSWPASLTYLNISYNKYNGYVAFPANLDTLICDNQIRETGSIGGPLGTFQTALPNSLRYLDCHANSVPGFSTPLPTSLTYLDASSQNLYFGLSGNLPVQCLDLISSLPATLKVLKCNHNSLVSLPALPAALEYLDCSDQVYSYTITGYGTFSNPGISSLPTLPPALNYLNCSSNPISCLPPLPLTMTGSSAYNNTGYNLAVNQTNVSCLPNWVPGIVMNPVGSYLPLCSTFNPNPCAANSVLKGHIFIDTNANGVQDPGEFPGAYVQVNLNNSFHTFTNVNGNYEFTALMGNDQLSVEAPSYYNPVPGTVSHTVINSTSVFKDTFALQPIALYDSIKISITASNNPRANGPLTYFVQYQNFGSTTVNANMTINFNGSLLTYNSSSNASVVHSGNTLTLAAGSLAPGQQGSFYSMFTVNAGVPTSMYITTAAQATAGTSQASDIARVIVVGAIDPNDKQATPALSFIDIANGSSIDYLVRFQNVGTSYAMNVFITDTLHAYLLDGTMELIATSHPGKITRSGNKILCEFINIILPDSTSNQVGSHGFVRFRIKPSNNLTANTVIPNKASVYFDYNLPVETNTANTIISGIPIPLTLLDFTGQVQSENKALLKWKTADESNTSRFEIEASSDGRNFGYAATEPAVGSGSNSYSRSLTMGSAVVFYRLKMIDTDGHFRYSPILRLSNRKSNTGLAVLNNPVKNELNILVTDNTLSNTKAFLFNSQGITVKTFIISGSRVQLNVADLATGVYYLKTNLGSEKILVSR